jgi:two-component sensor histidine kinase
MLDSATSVLTALATSTSEEELLIELATEALTRSAVDGVNIFLRDAQDVLVMRASTAAPEFVRRIRLGRGVGMCGSVFATGEPIHVGKNASEHPRYTQYPGFEDHDADAVAVIPLQIEGKPVEGVVQFTCLEHWNLTPKVKRDLKDLVDLIAHAIFAFRGAYQAGTQSNRLGALSEVSKTIAASPYLEEILQLLVNLTAQQFNYRVCTVRLLDENRNELVLRATQASAKAYQNKRAIKLGESIAGRAISENRPIIVADVRTEEDYIGHDLAIEQGLRSMICVPLTIQEKVIGVLSCYTDETRGFPADEVKALETLAKQAAISIEHAKLQVRTTLMQEMHHRVKNNLQQIASLMRLQMRHGQYKSLEEALNDTLSRILAISSVHDLLSREDLDHVGMLSIANTLVHHQQSSLILPDRHIGFAVRGDDVHLNMNQATQVALIINELISNAIEHGFAISTDGEIHVTIEEKESEVALWVSNSGDALPEGFDPSTASSLGLQIVENLSRALNGRFKMSNIFGWTVCEVKFTRSTGE